MAEICKNCNETITANFCSNCGQKKFKRIDGKYVWDEFQYTVLHTNKGFLYSVKQLLKNPGKTATAYIAGDRVNHYKPILLVFVLSGISTFISYKALHLKDVMADYFKQQNLNSQFMIDMMSFLSTYNSAIMLLLVPIFALTTKLAFRKWGHNYYEHLIMNAYILSYYTLISIIAVYPIMFVFRHNSEVFFTITQLSFLLVPIILLWFFKAVYSNKSFKSVLWRVAQVMGITLFGYILFILILGIVGFTVAAMQGENIQQYVQPK